MSDCESIQLCGDSEPEVIEIAGNDEPDVIEVDEPGPPGLSAYQIAVSHGFTGTEEEWLASLHASVEGLEIADIDGLQAALDARVLASSFSAFSLSLIDDVDAPAWRASLGLGDAATLNVGTASGTVAAGNHTHGQYLSKGTDGSGSNSAGTPTVIPPQIPTGNSPAGSIQLHSSIVGASGSTPQATFLAVETSGGVTRFYRPTGQLIAEISGLQTGNFGGGNVVGRIILGSTGGTSVMCTAGSDLAFTRNSSLIGNWTGGGIVNMSSGVFGWAGSGWTGATGPYLPTMDAAMARYASGSEVGAQVCNGTPGTYRDFIARAIRATGVSYLGAFNFATKPAAAASNGGSIRIIDRGYRAAYSDGSDWRWEADDQVIS